MSAQQPNENVARARTLIAEENLSFVPGAVALAWPLYIIGGATLNYFVKR